MKQKLRYRELFRFIVTGTIITVIHYSIYLALSNFLSLNIAYTTGFIISFVCNFLLSNYYTFKTKPSVKNAIRFCGSHVINYLLQISCFNLSNLESSVFSSIGLVSFTSLFLANFSLILSSTDESKSSSPFS